MEPNPKLKEFMKPYDEEIQNLTFEMRHFITELVPEANELIWDNYNAVAIAYSKSLKLKDAFCHISVYSRHINLGFNRGAELSHSDLKLEGKGKRIRHISVVDMQSFPRDEIIKLILEAVDISETMNKNMLKNSIKPQSLVMSVSEKKRRPN